jgi:tRNA(Arg) A34 adenosine deaminase TadA
MSTPNEFMAEAIALSLENVRQGGGPFGAVIVKDGQVIARGQNRVTATNDPTAHAEIVSIRAACAALKSFQLTDCDIYSSCEPCPMCLAAIYWARAERVFFANTRVDAAQVGFDDWIIYNEIALPFSERGIPMQQMMADEAKVAFDAWKTLENKVEY